MVTASRPFGTSAKGNPEKSGYGNTLATTVLQSAPTCTRTKNLLIKRRFREFGLKDFPHET
jgi:hypothetical protein